jgi:octaheme c-type cytochrome (tetrathionate reductase family)
MPSSKKSIVSLLFILSFLIFSINYAQQAVNYDLKSEPHTHKAGTDHSLFPALQKEFKTPEEVTQACLSCHTNRGKEIMATPHWLWKQPNKDNKHDGTYMLGKANVINNFCIGIESNEPRCTSCHAGYGWKNKDFDFSNQNKIDCLICHDNTGTYKKFPTGAGYPAEKDKVFKGNGKTYHRPDYSYIAQHIGLPKRQNCGACHFTGGGGNNVKHGDLELALNKTTKKVDVHMGIDGQNMQCIECHKTEHHNITGKLYTIASDNTNRVTCTQCHVGKVHADEKINDHMAKVACETCHIPVYAKVNPVKLSWDWSTAGKMKNGKPFKIEGPYGKDTYFTLKGNFKWGKNVQPEYQFFNGTASHTLLTDKIDPTKTVELNHLNGSYLDPNSKLVPVRVFHGRQIYDAKFNHLIQPKLFGPKGSGAYWKEFDWGKAAEAGMKYVGVPYSGKYGFVNTVSYWQIEHMVSPKEDALKCQDCHVKKGGRLANVNDPDLYVPGRDSNATLDTFGVILLLLTLIGVAIHGFGRFYFNRKK